MSSTVQAVLFSRSLKSQDEPLAGTQACVAQLWRHNVDLEAMLLKPMMVMPGADAGSKASPEEVAQATLDALRRYGQSSS